MGRIHHSELENEIHQREVRGALAPERCSQGSVDERREHKLELVLTTSSNTSRNSREKVLAGNWSVASQGTKDGKRRDRQ